jgi:hypothetical protein
MNIAVSMSCKLYKEAGLLGDKLAFWCGSACREATPMGLTSGVLGAERLVRPLAREDGVALVSIAVIIRACKADNQKKHAVNQERWGGEERRRRENRKLGDGWPFMHSMGTNRQTTT